MIELSDLTILEAQGSFPVVTEIMGNGVWMLRSEAVIVTPIITARYLLHFWNDGRVVIMETEHPPMPSIPDDDIRELKNWCDCNGWKGPYINSLLLSDPRFFDFWFRFFRAGIVYNEVFDEAEKEELQRFSVANIRHLEEDQDVI